MAANRYTVRAVCSADVVKLNEIFRQRKPSLQAVFGRFEWSHIVEITLYSLVATNVEQELVAFAAFDDAPPVPGNVAQNNETKAAQWATLGAIDIGYLKENILWLKLAVALSTKAEEEMDVLSTLMQAAVTLAPNTQVFLHTSPLDQHILPTIFKPMSRSQEYRIMISSCIRSTVFPPLQVTRAKVEDYDDLIPIIEKAQARHYPLSHVPQVVDPSKAYSIARMIAGQNHHNSVLVAKVANKLVGIMACTAVIDFESYQAKFNVDIYDMLTTQKEHQPTIPPLPPIQEPKLVADTPASNTLPFNLSMPTAPTKTTAPKKGPPKPEVKLTPAQQREEEEKLKKKEVELQAKAKVEEEKRLKELEQKRIDDEKRAKELEIKRKQEEERQRIHAKKRRASLLNKAVFQITFLCIEEEFESRAIDFLQAAFKGFEIRPAKSIDANGIGELVDDFVDGRSIVESIHYPKEGCIHMVATLSTQIVGYAMLEESAPVDALFSHFNLASFLTREDHPDGAHAIIILFVLNPIFRYKRKFFLREIMQQTGKTVLYYPMFANQELPDVLDDLFLLSGRQHEQMAPSCIWGKIPIKSTRALSHSELPRPQRKTSLIAGIQPGSGEHRGPRQARGQFQGFDCALYCTTHRLNCQTRALVSAQIVVVGASRTAAAFLHRLLADRQLQFANLTLISSKGLQALSSSVSSSFDMDPGPGESFYKLGIDCQVNVITASVVKMDRENRHVLLSTGRYVPFDYLILTTGVQDQTKYKIKQAGDCKYVVRAEDLSVLESSLGGDRLAPEGELVVLYGFSLEAFNVMHMLLRRGIEGKNIILICPETKALVELAGACFGDPAIGKLVMDRVQQAGVVCKTNWLLTSFQVNMGDGKLESLTFESIVKKEEVQTDDEDDVVSRSSRSTKSSISTTPEGPPPEIYVQACTMLITCDKKHVDFPLFQSINQASIIYDGRIVVDGRFQTVDPNIFAAGSVSKFSRHCGDIPKLEHNNSLEVGVALADSVLSRFAHYIPPPAIVCPSLPALCPGPAAPQTDSAATASPKWPCGAVPSLSRAKGVGGLLPGGLWYFCISAPECFTRQWEVVKCEHTLASQVSDCYFRMDLVESNQVGRIVYCGSKKLEAWKMLRIVGLSEYLLNFLVKRAPPVQDVPQYLLQPWAAALFHNSFLPFYNELLQQLVSQEEQDKRTVARTVRKEFLKFIKLHKSDFPMYRDS